MRHDASDPGRKECSILPETQGSVKTALQGILGLET
jgi:hypothetical protein